MTSPPYHYADRHLSLGIVLVLALITGVALLLVLAVRKKGGKR